MKEQQIQQGLVPPGCPAAARLHLVDTGSNVLFPESGSGALQPEGLPGTATLCGGPHPPGVLRPFHLGHFQERTALSGSLCLGQVLTATATYTVTWQHCSMSTHVVTDVCQAGRNLQAPCCCFFFAAGVCPGAAPGPCAEDCPQERRVSAEDTSKQPSSRGLQGNKAIPRGPLCWNWLT